MKGITKTGFEYDVDDNLINNMELIDALVDIQNGSTGAVSDLLNCMFDKAQKKRLYDHVREESGRVPMDKCLIECTEIIQASGEAGKN